LLDAIAAGAKAGNWEDVQKDSDLLKAFGEGLGKNKPSKGDEESWKKLAGKYKENTLAVDTAADKKDAKGVADAIAAIKGSCKECHTAHKGK